MFGSLRILTKKMTLVRILDEFENSDCDRRLGGDNVASGRRPKRNENEKERKKQRKKKKRKKMKKRSLDKNREKISAVS